MRTAQHDNDKFIKFSITRSGQSALEYLMTYGWAILIIVIVAVILYSMGIFNPSSSISSTVTGFTGLGSVTAQCEAGGLIFSIGDSAGSVINISSITLTVNNKIYADIFPSYVGNPSDYTIRPGQLHDFLIVNACPNNTARFSSTVSVTYTEPGAVIKGPYLSTGTVSGNSVVQYDLYTTNLIGFWPMTQNAGNEIYDLSGNSNNLIVGGSYSWLSGPFCNGGSCINFTANANMSNHVIPMYQKFTICMWEKAYKSATEEYGFADTPPFIMYLYNSGTTPSMMFAIFNTSNYEFYPEGGYSLPSYGQWGFICGSYNGQTITNWYDGQQENSASITTSIRTGAGITFFNRKLYYGSIDYIYYYNESLSSSEIYSLYKSPLVNFGV
jgi:hypothetical protein